MAARVGRPPFQPTAAQRKKVAIAAGGGMSHEAIALALGIDAGTLVKHFSHELTVGAYEKRNEVLQAMFKAAKKGNVGAARLYTALSVKAAAPDVAPEARQPEPEGKKAQANADARVAQLGTDWESLLPHSSVQ